MVKKKNARHMRIVRHARARKRVSGTAERPRLAVFRSLRNVFAQVIDDIQGRTTVAASSLDVEVASQRGGKTKKDVSRLVGSLIAKRAREKGVSRVVFDRGGYKYHGRIRAVAEGAREEGLEF